MKNGHDINRTLEELRSGVWAGAYSEWRLNEAMYDGEYSIPVPLWSKTPVVSPPTANNIIRFATAQLVTTEPVVHRRSLKDTPAARKQAEMLKTSGALILRNMARQMAMNQWQAFFKNLLMYGYAASYGPIPIMDLWNDAHDAFTTEKLLPSSDEWLKRSRAIFPFTLRVPNPRSIVMDPSEGKNPSFGIMEQEIPAATLKKKFDVGSDLLKGNDWTLWRTVTYADDDELSMWLKRGDSPAEAIYQTENFLGYVPFNQTFAGFGLERTQIGRSNARYLAESLLTPSRSTLQSDARIATYIEQIVRELAFRQKYVSKNSGIDEYSLGQSALVQVNKDANSSLRDMVHVDESVQLPNWLLTLAQMRKGEAEGSTLSPVLKGERIEGTYTASQHAQQVSKARLLYAQPIQALNDVAAYILGNCFRLIDLFGDQYAGGTPIPLTLEGMIEGELKAETITGSDLQGDYTCYVNFEEADPMEQMARLEMGIRLRTPGVGPLGGAAISFSEFQSMKGARDPASELRLLQDERLQMMYISNPNYLQTLQSIIMQEYDIPMPELGAGGQLPTGPGQGQATQLPVGAPS